MKVQIGKFFKTVPRKIEVQVDKWDTWNLDHTLALIIYPALLQLKQEKHGIPGALADVGGESHASQSSFDFYTETHDEAFNEAVKRWDEILDKMIWSFQQLAHADYEEKYTHGDRSFDFVKAGTTTINGKAHETFSIVPKHPDTWTDYAGIEMHEQRIQEGLELFGKYYRSLWD
jgi:hypothetical protein